MYYKNFIVIIIYYFITYIKILDNYISNIEKTLPPTFNTSININELLQKLIDPLDYLMFRKKYLKYKQKYLSIKHT
jgi:hypothetical protein